ncbi:MAG: hypothetical protein ACLP9L_14490 [Thermoguttaceae bacterium]
MRIWICLECGRAEEVSYDRLAEHGKPACGQCERDMELRPEAEATADDRATVVERLVNKAESAGLKAEDLDETVHDLMSSIASDINNGGLEDQVTYLVEGLGEQDTERQIDELIEERQRTGE